jgi:hypothetical protein
MIKGLSALMYDPKQTPHFFHRPINSREVTESNTVITAQLWSVHDVDDPRKMKTYSIGESRPKNIHTQKPMVIMVYERCMMRHNEKLIEVIQE